MRLYDISLADIESAVSWPVLKVQILYPDLGVDEPLTVAARSYDLDVEALIAAAQAALAAPDRPVTLDVAVRSVA